MRITSIKLQNFRCFKEARMDLPPSENIAVLVAENGQGKSTVLDAIRIGLWTYVSGFDLARTGFNAPGNAITVEDVRLIRMPQGDMARQLPSSITTTAQLDDGIEIEWGRYRESERKATKTKDGSGAKRLRMLAEQQQIKIRDPGQRPITLPFIGYYGTGRLWAQKRLTEYTKGKDDTLDKDFYVRTFAYQNCLDPASSYKHFREWFVWAYEAFREQETQDGSPTPTTFPEKDRILAVQRTIDILLREATGWHQLEYSIRHAKALVMHHDEFGIMDVETLSDGIRSVLAMVGDIAYRCVKLNPHLGANAAQETAGIALIDEIDMHLHPRWQQIIVDRLQRAFPRIQFILTTHSPQVLSALRKECIWIIHDDNQDLKIGQPAVSPLGHDAGYALAHIMGTHATPDIENIKTLIADYQQYVRSGQEDHPQAVEMLHRMKTLGYQIHPSDLTLWRMMARHHQSKGLQ